MPQSFLFIIGLILIRISVLSGQNFGGVPPGKKWESQESNKVKIIFDHQLNHIPDSILHYMDQINQNDPFSLGANRDFVNLILRNENLTSNGFVGYFPFRSEFYLHGAQDPNLIGFGDWIHLLSLHEYRHVTQYSNIRQGFLRPVRNVLGDAAQAGVYSILVPDWFSEGDAVFFETAVSNAGRGRLPAFTADLRALLLAGKNYSYAKYRNGSFRQLVPNHYVHGYLLAGYGHEISENFWKNVFEETARLKGILTPFSRSIRRQSGHHLHHFHEKAIDHFKHTISSHLPENPIAGNPLFQDSESIRSEFQYLSHSDDRQFLLEQSFDEINTLYEITGGQKIKRFALGRTTDPFLRIQENKIIFINQKTHPRWTNREYGDIYYFDLEENKTIRVTNQEKILSADYSNKKNLYAAVEATHTGENKIILLNPANGEKKILLQDHGTYYSYPTWLKDLSDTLIFTGRKNGKMYLGLYDISTHQTDTLLPPQSATIARPYQDSNYIYYSSGQSGIDNIYRIHIHQKHVEQITDVLTGAYNPTSYRDTLFYSLKTENGQRIYKTKINPLNRLLLASGSFQDETKFLFQDLFLADSTKNKLQSDGFQTYSSQVYRPGKNLFHFHSLFLELSGTNPRLSLVSNDYLNIADTELYGQFYESEKSYEIGSRFTYAKWYPELSVSAAHHWNRRLGIMIDDEISLIPKSDTKIHLSAALPWNFSTRQINHHLRLSGSYGITREHFDPYHPVLPPNIDIEPRLFQTGRIRTRWLIHRLQAYRNIFPKWGITSEAQINFGLSPAKSQLFYTHQDFFIPGFSKNDGFKLKWQGQWNSEFASNQIAHQLKSSNPLTYDHTRLTKGNIFTINYITPLFYPEIYIPHFIFTKRIALNLSTEHFISDAGSSTWSAIDLFLTAKYFNLVDLTAGVRVARQWPLSRGPVHVRILFLQDL